MPLNIYFMGINYSAANDQIHHKQQSRENPDDDPDDFSLSSRNSTINDDTQNISNCQSQNSYQQLQEYPDGNSRQYFPHVN